MHQVWEGTRYDDMIAKEPEVDGGIDKYSPFSQPKIESTISIIQCPLKMRLESRSPIVDALYSCQKSETEPETRTKTNNASRSKTRSRARRLFASAAEWRLLGQWERHWGYEWGWERERKRTNCSPKSRTRSVSGSLLIILRNLTESNNKVVFAISSIDGCSILEHLESYDDLESADDLENYDNLVLDAEG
jgi:hypothetical protein